MRIDPTSKVPPMPIAEIGKTARLPRDGGLAFIGRLGLGGALARRCRTFCTRGRPFTAKPSSFTGETLSAADDGATPLRKNHHAD